MMERVMLIVVEIIVVVVVCGFCFFFKQKTAYEVRMSDWSSDVCSSDLAEDALERHRRPRRGARQDDRGHRTAAQASRSVSPAGHPAGEGLPALWPARHRQDRKSVV